jgi:MFS transporter, DHA2 family, multidrug resistance protein
MSGGAIASAADGPGAWPAPPTRTPWLGLLAVLLGAFISTLTGRLSTFGLADIRGALHVGFDEGAWITTAQTVAQMLIAPAAVWMGRAYGPRRVLTVAACAFAVNSTLLPLSPNLPTFLILQFCGGLASGCFVPLTLGFILMNVPQRVWAWGIAIYALSLELSLNISASLEGWYVDHLSWRFIFWQNVPLALGMAACLHFGAPPEAPNPYPPPVDRYGLVTAGVALSLIYAALDQGNRLDWLNSGLIWALLLPGGVLLAAFFVHEARTAHPLLDFKVAFASPLPQLLLLIAFLRLTVLSTAFLIPQYLQAVRGFRALEVGQTLLWIAAPQLILCPLAALMLRRLDPRMVASIGFVLISLACLSVAHGLTPLWGSDQFLPSQLMQAAGQSLALSGVQFYAALHLRPQDGLTFGAMLQTARLMGGEVGQAFVVTLDRVRGQVASNLIGSHVQIGAAPVVLRLQDYAAATARAGGDSQTRAAVVLGSVVRSQAATQGVIDAFVVVAGLTAVALMLVITNRPAPVGPASHLPLFGRRGALSP